MIPKIRLLICLLIVTGSGGLIAQSVFAQPMALQPMLVEATPPPDAILMDSPELIRLVFSEPLADQGTRIEVLNAAGERMNPEEAQINPANRREISLIVPKVIEGVYTISYQVTALGGSTSVVGEYTFTINLPAPQIFLESPVDGKMLPPGPVEVILDASFFDFKHFNNRVRVYLNDELVEEAPSYAFTLEGVEPGVHEMVVVLARLEDDELIDTAVKIHFTIAGTESESPSAVDTPQPLPPLSWWQTLVLAILAGLLIGVGWWLGREPDQPDIVSW